MASPKGCFKSCAIGCGVALLLAVIGSVILGRLAWRAVNDDGAQGRDASQAMAGDPAAVAEPLSARAARLTTTHGGRVHLLLGEGGFHLRPAAPGEGIHAHARYDTTRHRLTERFAVLPDSTWEYSLEFRRAKDGAFSGMSGEGKAGKGRKREAEVTVYLPPEVPLDLVLRGVRGGCEADLGGLWLRNGDLDFLQGGFEVEFSSPLREAMESLKLRARMGGLEAKRVGNASPRVLDVDCAMGGGDIDLRGAWRGDCDARAAVKLGGISLTVPAEMRVEGYRAAAPELARPSEVPTPVLRLTATKKFGEVEIKR